MSFAGSSPVAPVLDLTQFRSHRPVRASALRSGRKPGVGTRVRRMWAVEHSVDGPGHMAALGGRRALARVERGRGADRASRSVRRREHDLDDAAGRRACRAAHRRSRRTRAVRRRGRRRRLRRPYDTPGRGRRRRTLAHHLSDGDHGPAAETVGPEIGPEISGDFPQVLAALAARAEGRA
jgi:hypothetical protein